MATTIHERRSSMVHTAYAGGYVLICRDGAAAQLHRMRFYSGPHLWHHDHLTENGKAIYRNLCERYNVGER